MRKFNFNNFKKSEDIPAPSKPTKPRFSAYRTIISRHDDALNRLKDEERAEIKDQFVGILPSNKRPSAVITCSIELVRTVNTAFSLWLLLCTAKPCETAR